MIQRYFLFFYHRDLIKSFQNFIKKNQNKNKILITYDFKYLLNIILKISKINIIINILTLFKKLKTISPTIFKTLPETTCMCKKYLNLGCAITSSLKIILIKSQ